MLRAVLLAGLVVLVHSPLMADAGVYELPDYSPFCEETERSQAS